jgi:hypothetical protein
MLLFQAIDVKTAKQKYKNEKKKKKILIYKLKK